MRSTTCDVDLTKDDESATLSMNIEPSLSETGLGQLDYESSREAASRELKENNRERNIQYTLIAKDLPLESTRQRTLLQALYEDSIMSFLTSVKALYVPCEKSTKMNSRMQPNKNVIQVRY